MKNPSPTLSTRREFLHQAGVAAAAAIPLFIGIRPLFGDDQAGNTTKHRITDHGTSTHRSELNTGPIQAAMVTPNASFSSQVLEEKE